MKDINVLPPEAVEHICATLQCAPADIQKVEALKVGLTNSSYSLFVGDERYVYRHPGKNTHLFIDRKSEAFSEMKAKELGLDQTVIAIDSDTGWKLSHFIHGSSHLDCTNFKDQKKAMSLLRVLHRNKIKSPYDFDYMKETEKIFSLLKKDGVDFDAVLPLHQKVQDVEAEMQRMAPDLGYEYYLCHNDAWAWNMIRGADAQVTLIDWEYSGNYYYQADVAYFTSSREWPVEEYLSLATLYEGRELSSKEERFYVDCLVVVLWYWYVWAIYKEHTGTNISDMDLWKKKVTDGLDWLQTHPLN